MQHATTNSATASDSGPDTQRSVAQYRLLVGFDFSAHADLALNHALSLANARSNVQLHVVWALPPGEIESNEVSDDALTGYQQRLTDHLTAKFESLERSGYNFGNLETVVHVTPDLAHEAIERTAYLEGVHLVVVGTRDLGGFQKLMLGSVAQEVVKNAKCPVMVCRERAADQVPQVEPPPAPGQEGSHLGRRHTYHYRGRNASSQINLPLLVPMSMQ